MKNFRQIIHLDMDAFYASVEVLDDPSLAGRPVVVGGLGNRGVVSTASYEARVFGVHSAMPMSRARRLCPQGLFIRPRLRRYKEVSQKIMSVFRRYTPLMEPLSLDEAFLDVTASRRLFGSAEDIARAIKAAVRSEVGLTVTAGVATQKHLAKMASGLNKPDGLTVIQPGRELDFLRPRPLKDLWGVGAATLKKFEEMGLRRIGDLAALDGGLVEKHFGRSGRVIWELANGHDPREVEPDASVKSVGTEETYAEDLTRLEEFQRELLALSFEAARRLRRQGLKGRTITVKIRDSDFKTITRARTLPSSTDLRQEISRVAWELASGELLRLRNVRLLGVSLSGLSGAGQLEPAAPTLFESPAGQERSASLNRALDAIADRFGEGALKPATLKLKERDFNED